MAVYIPEGGIPTTTLAHGIKIIEFLRALLQYYEN